MFPILSSVAQEGSDPVVAILAQVCTIMQSKRKCRSTDAELVVFEACEDLDDVVYLHCNNFDNGDKRLLKVFLSSCGEVRFFIGVFVNSFG